MNFVNPNWEIQVGVNLLVYPSSMVNCRFWLHYEKMDTLENVSEFLAATMKKMDTLSKPGHTLIVGPDAPMVRTVKKSKNKFKFKIKLKIKSIIKKLKIKKIELSF